jgi:hypothetical protein
MNEKNGSVQQTAKQITNKKQKKKPNINQYTNKLEIKKWHLCIKSHWIRNIKKNTNPTNKG